MLRLKDLTMLSSPVESDRLPIAPVLTVRREAAALLRLAAPLIGAQLAQISMNLVDTVMAGQLGAQALAAVAVGSNAWMPIFCIGLGIIMSVTPTVAHLYGAQRRDEIGEVVRQGVWLSLALTPFSILILEWVPTLLAAFRVDPAIAPTAAAYVRALVWGFPALMTWNVLRAFSEGIGRTQPIMWISLVSLPFNAVGNYTLMYGVAGFPRLGAIGCGYASAATMWFMLLLFVLWIRLDPAYRPYRFFARFSRPDFRQLSELVAIGLPIGFSIFMEGGMFCTVGLMMGQLGVVSAAANQIALNVASVTFMVPLGVAMAVTVRVGQALGRNEPRAARRTGWVGNILCVGFMSLSAVLMACFPQAIARWYTHDSAVLAVVGELLLLAALFQVFDGLQVSGAGALRGLKDTQVPMLITFVAYWLLGLPLAIWLGLHQGIGPRGFWTGLILGLIAAATLLNLRFYRQTARLIQAHPPQDLPLHQIEDSDGIPARQVQV